jgi:hypothetical protein
MNLTRAALGMRFWRPNQTKGRPCLPPLRSHSTVSS